MIVMNDEGSLNFMTGVELKLTLTPLCSGVLNSAASLLSCKRWKVLPHLSCYPLTFLSPSKRLNYLSLHSPASIECFTGLKVASGGYQETGLKPVVGLSALSIQTRLPPRISLQQLEYDIWVNCAAR